MYWKDCDQFQHPTRRVNKLWQTDFTYIRVIGWGWSYLSTVLDDYSRYIIAWKLFGTMAASDVQETLDLAMAATGASQVQVRHRPRLLSDNGPCYVSHDSTGNPLPQGEHQAANSGPTSDRELQDSSGITSKPSLSKPTVLCQLF